jgi:hypothetical protein
MKTLAWMTLQAAIIASVVLMQSDVGRQLGKEPDYGTAFVFGIVAAFLVTVAIVIVRDTLLAWRSRRAAAPTGGIYRDAGTALRIPAVGSDDGEPGSERQSLAAPSRSGGDSPKLIGSSRVGQEPR